MTRSSNDALDGATQGLRARLPPGWAVEVIQSTGSQASLRFTSSEGRSRAVPVAIRHHIDPRAAGQITGAPSLIVVAPYLSRAARAVLEGRGLSYADPTGNMRVILDEPGLFVLTSGAQKNPRPQKRRLSLRGLKAGRLVRALVRSTPPLGVRALAEQVGTDPGYVSRLLKRLDGAALVDRGARGRVERVAWRELLTRWSEDAPLSSRAEATTWLAPRGLKGALKGLGGVELPYLITGSAVAARVAPVAPPRLLSVYVHDPIAVAAALGLRRAEAGANVVLLRSADEAIYERAEVLGALREAELPLVVADLLTGSGRSPAEAEALMDWMDLNREVWRG